MYLDLSLNAMTRAQRQQRESNWLLRTQNFLWVSAVVVPDLFNFLVKMTEQHHLLQGLDLKFVHSKDLLSQELKEFALFSSTCMVLLDDH